MSWKTSFKICGAIILIAAFVTGITIYARRGRADVKAIALSRDDIIKVSNLQSQARELKIQFDAKNAEIEKQFAEIRKTYNPPDDFVLDVSGSTVVGFRPMTKEEKDRAAHPTP